MLKKKLPPQPIFPGIFIMEGVLLRKKEEWSPIY
jgi:hypothetical protein